MQILLEYKLGKKIEDYKTLYRLNNKELKNFDQFKFTLFNIKTFFQIKMKQNVESPTGKINASI